MQSYDQELHIEDEVFGSMREDANRVLHKLLKNMVDKDSMEGSVTIKLDVSFIQEFIPNRDPSIEGKTRRVLTPKFSHKVGSVMQIKDETKGDRNCDGTELVWDDERKEYVLRPIANTEQMTIFDADFRCVNDDDEEEAAQDEGEKFLEGRRVAALPGPSDTEGDEPKEVTEGEPEDLSEEFDRGDLPFVEGDGDDDYGYDEPEEY